jgi:4-azaleucine resistance transporter AzlC
VAEHRHGDPPDSYLAGARDGLVLALIIGVFGASFGVLARAEGMGPLAPVVLSLTTFSGSAQFASLGVLAAGGGAVTATITALLINARYLPIGISAAPAFVGNPLLRLLKAQTVLDESWAVALTPDGRVLGRRMLGAGMLIYVTWVSGTVIGVVAGDFIGDPQRLGLDAAFPALFLALLWPRLRSREGVAAAALGATIALGLAPFVQPGVPILVASVVALLGLRRP